MQPEKAAWRIEEIWCRNGEKKIYGLAYVPAAAGKHPLVLFSHELGRTHEAGVPYAEKLAAAGYAVYVFDFCGGTVGPGNRSDGTNLEMSVMTEVSDLDAVLDAAKTWSFADPERIVLMGASQGGAVSALVGCRRSEEIAAMILLYPALNIFAALRRGFGSVENVPAEFEMFDGWIRVGSRYATDVWDVDVYARLSDYPGRVLLLHGDRDRGLKLAHSERAAAAIRNCEFHVVPGGGHGFRGEALERAAALVLEFLQTVVPVE